MDIQAIITKLEEKIKIDPQILAELKADPAKTIEKLIGEVIPEDKIKDIISGLEQKLAGSGVVKEAEEKLKEHGGLSGIFDSIKKLF